MNLRISKTLHSVSVGIHSVLHQVRSDARLGIVPHQTLYKTHAPKNPTSESCLGIPKSLSRYAWIANKSIDRVRVIWDGCTKATPRAKPRFKKQEQMHFYSFIWEASANVERSKFKLKNCQADSDAHNTQVLSNAKSAMLAKHARNKAIARRASKKHTARASTGPST